MMRIRGDNLHAHELIGLDLTVEGSRDPTLLGLHGRVVYESRNMLHIRVNDSNGYRIKAVPKGITTLLFILPDGSRRIIEGKDLIGRPEDRVERIERVRSHGRW
ncbi:MAG: ribonuclease P protein subunit [Candidatus Nitrosocaldus sp.]|nr:ribonuclease P protein subunit [Candidatus Nitrosocaldus sp.]